ncbi:hypothetical protein K501DRAFT_328217 [Backusella circina FSU 941]|nr:hypothetical protein K501DRAFT_328217 [Backusella circina FSU 941]
MNPFTKLKQRVSSHKWVKAYLALAFIQAAVAISLMIPIFLNSERIAAFFETYQNSDLTELYKRYKMYLESIIYFIFELWRICLILDSILQMNSLTLYASACGTIFSFILSLSVLVEYFKLTHDDPPEVIGFSILNKNMQLGFSCTIFVMVIPTIWVATRVEKEIGWSLYKKLGASMELQKMFKAVQCLSLMVKVDVFFEVVFMCFLVAEIISPLYQGLAIAVLVILAISLLVARESIARESHFLMGLFIAIQLMYLIVATLILTLPDEMGETAMGLFFLEWYAFSIYYVFGMLAGVLTIFFAICCQINFGRGLKDHVQWSFYGLRKAKNTKALEEQAKKTNEKLNEIIDIE